MSPPPSSLAVLAALLYGCIEAPSLRRLPEPLRVIAVETPTRDLDSLARVASITVRFDRPIAWPDETAALLVRGAPSDALRSDAADGALSPTNALRAIGILRARSALDPSELTIDALDPLLPETALTLLIPPRPLGADGSSLARDDGGSRALAVALTVAPARVCGALARVECPDPGDAPLRLARLYVRFDRAVRLARAVAPLALTTDAGRLVPSRSSLDCSSSPGWHRCASIEPLHELDPSTVYRVALGPLVARNGAPVEAAPLFVATGSRLDAPVASFSAALVCAPSETRLDRFCVRTSDRWIEVRAMSTCAALLRVTSQVVGAPPDPPQVAVGAAATHHTLRVSSLRAASGHALVVELLGADGRVHERRPLGPVSTCAPLPRARITEVLARPRGIAAQEFVELLNESTAPVDLSGYVLLRGASRAVFPANAIIPAGRRAVVVGASFDPRGTSRGDPPLAPGAVLIALGNASLGLLDDGSDVSLLSPDGRELSAYPGGSPARTPRLGASLVRVDVDLDDSDPAAWAYDSADGCTPGGPDRAR